MSSYNRIEKIKYTKNPSDVVALYEYILFEDEKAEEKYVVFKFMNNLNQRLRELKFEVLQYDEENELLEKSVVVHDNFVAEQNAMFVPNAKLRVNFACKSLRVNLVFAAFDRVKWEKGELRDNSYAFESYAKDAGHSSPAGKSISPVQTVALPAPQEIPKNGFVIKNVFRRNIAVFPKVFFAFVCIALVVFVAVTLFLFRRSASKFNIDGFDLMKVSEDSVNICGYDGTDSELTIPAKIGEYTVHKITANAFKNSKVKSIVFATEDIVIESNAFASCNSLTIVTSSSDAGTITVLKNGFINCTNLNTVKLQTAQLTRYSLSGCMNVKYLYFDCFAAGGYYPLKELFGEDVKQMRLNTIEVNFDCNAADFLQDVIYDHFFRR